MKLCNESITVYNKRWDADAGYDLYYPTVINGVSWFCEIASAVDNAGLHAANRFVIRIPVDAGTGGKSYVDPIAYKDAPDVDGIYTLAQGDVVVKAAIVTALVPKKPAELHAEYSDCCTILGVTDNRRAPNAPHFKVVGS